MTKYIEKSLGVVSLACGVGACYELSTSGNLFDVFSYTSGALIANGIRLIIKQVRQHREHVAEQIKRDEIAKQEDMQKWKDLLIAAKKANIFQKTQ